MVNGTAGRLIEIQHVPEILKDCLDSALTPRNIKSGFSATGIFPPNRNIFTDEDYQLAAITGENMSATAETVHPDDQRNLVFFNDPPGAQVEVSTSASEITSTSSVVSTSGASLSDSLTEMGLLIFSNKTKHIPSEEKNSIYKNIRIQSSSTPCIGTTKNPHIRRFSVIFNWIRIFKTLNITKIHSK